MCSLLPGKEPYDANNTMPSDTSGDVAMADPLVGQIVEAVHKSAGT